MLNSILNYQGRMFIQKVMCILLVFILVFAALPVDALPPEYDESDYVSSSIYDDYTDDNDVEEDEETDIDEETEDETEEAETEESETEEDIEGEEETDCECAECECDEDNHCGCKDNLVDIAPVLPQLPALDFVPVATLHNLPTETNIGIPLYLTGDVYPSNATNQSITWSISDPGATGAVLVDNELHAFDMGTVIVRATIANGATASDDFVHDFSVRIFMGFTPQFSSMSTGTGRHYIWPTRTETIVIETYIFPNFGYTGSLGGATELAMNQFLNYPGSHVARSTPVGATLVNPGGISLSDVTGFLVGTSQQRFYPPAIPPILGVRTGYTTTITPGFPANHHFIGQTITNNLITPGHPTRNLGDLTFSVASAIPPTLSANISHVDFGTRVWGQSIPSASVTLTRENGVSASSISFSNPTITGPFAGFNIGSINPPGTALNNAVPQRNFNITPNSRNLGVGTHTVTLNIPATRQGTVISSAGTPAPPAVGISIPDITVTIIARETNAPSGAAENVVGENMFTITAANAPTPLNAWTGSPGTGWTTQYRLINSATGAVVRDWDISLNFTGLTDGTTYTVEMYHRANNVNHLDSAVSTFNVTTSSPALPLDVTYTVTGITPDVVNGMPPTTYVMPTTSVDIAPIPTTPSTTNAAGVQGTWTFNGWNHPTITTSPFSMPNNAVHFTGYWTFTPAQFSVTYTVTGAEPPVVTNMPTGSTPVDAGTTGLTIAPEPTTTSTTNAAGTQGTWTFSGWNHATITTSPFTMPNNHVAFTGYWTFTPAQFNVTYTVTGVEPPVVANMPTGSTPVDAGTTGLTIAPEPTTTSTTNAAGTQGTWTFSGWSHATITTSPFTMPNNHVAFTGYWTFIPAQFNVTYTVTGIEPPVVANMPSASTPFAAGTIGMLIAPNPTTTSTINALGVEGGWVFSGWNHTTIISSPFIMPNNHVEFTGYWTFTPAVFSINYEVIGVRPAIENNMPPAATPTTAGTAGLTIAPYPTTTSLTNAAGVMGTWTFDGWNHPTITTSPFTMPNSNVTFTGTWTFTPAQFNVTYTVTGIEPSVVANMPAASTSVAAGTTGVVIAPSPTTTSTTNGAGVQGAWTFSGWFNATVSSSPFTMPNNNVAFTGYWTFTPDTFDVTYTVTGVEPAVVTGMPPALTTLNAGTTGVVIAASPITTSNTNTVGVQGTWTFSGWSNATITSSPFIMPNHDVAFTGYWIFTPDTFNLTINNLPNAIGIPSGQTPSGIMNAGDTITLVQGTNPINFVFMGWVRGATLPALGSDLSSFAGTIYLTRTFTMPNESLTYTAIWGDGTYVGLPTNDNLTINNLPNNIGPHVGQTATGSVVVSTDITLAEGTAPADFVFMGWVRGATLPALGSDLSSFAGTVYYPTRTFTMPNEAITYTAIWGDGTYVGVPINDNLTIDNLPNNIGPHVGQTATGSVAVGVDVILAEGTAPTNFVFMGWVRGATLPALGSDLSSFAGTVYYPTRHFIMPNEDLTYTAIWGDGTFVGVPTDYNLIINNLPNTIDPHVNQTKSEGVIVGTHVNLEEGIHPVDFIFMGWVRGDVLPALGSDINDFTGTVYPTRSFTMPNEVITYTALWGNGVIVGKPLNYNLFINNLPDNIGPHVDQTESGATVLGSTVTLDEGIAPEGFMFMGWVRGSDLPAIGTNINDFTAVPVRGVGHSFTMPNDAVVYTALWGNGTHVGVPLSFNLTVGNFPPSFVPVGQTPTGITLVEAGTALIWNEGTVATYDFLGWATDTSVLVVGSVLPPSAVVTPSVAMPSNDTNYFAVWGNSSTGIIGEPNIPPNVTPPTSPPILGGGGGNLDGGFRPTIPTRPEPPTPSVVGNEVVNNDDGMWVEFDDTGIPQGAWEWNEDEETWIFDEDNVPLAAAMPSSVPVPVAAVMSLMPQTGITSTIPLLLAGLLAALILAGFAVTYIRKIKRSDIA
ncbi:MAG: SHIRT domain-containing protein [Defluviitaleaceae bacterium]|nr:SHIRT domain-containing protein [Defluviitaleaceae bacterium]